MKTIEAERESRQTSTNVLGRGTNREVFFAGPGKCAKALMPTTERRKGQFIIFFPMEDYLKNKFGIDDLNLYELGQYHKYIENIDNGLSECFAKLLEVKDDLLYMELITDIDRSVSLNMGDSGLIKSKSFWEKMLELKQFLFDQNIPCFDMRQKNIVVQHKSEKVIIPVFIDYKYFGTKLIPNQPWLKIPIFARIKMQKQFTKLVKEHAPFEFWDWLL